MEDNTDLEQSKTETTKPTKNKKWPMWLLVVLVLLLLGAAGYLWWQLKVCQDSEANLRKDKQQLQQQIDTLKAAKQTSNAEELACNDTPTASMKENIKAALDSKNTAAFSTYTTNPVKYVLAASELGADVTPDQAATNLEYTHSATGPWDFNLPKATTDAYDAGFYTSYFDTNTYVGKAASGMVVSFDFDCSGKIKQIFVAADAGIL